MNSAKRKILVFHNLSPERRNVKQQFYPHNPFPITISSSDLRTPSKKLSSNRLGACFAVQVHFLISCMHGLAKPPALTPRRRHRAVAVQSPHRRTVAARSPHPSTVARPPPHTPGRTAAHGARRRSTLRLTALQRWAAAKRQYAAAAEAAARQHAP